MTERRYLQQTTMRSDSVPISVVKSISQRALASYWLRLVKGSQFPSFVDFEPGSRMHDPKQLVVWAVEHDEAGRRFRAMYQGGCVAEAFETPWAGKTMDAVVPEFLKKISLDAAHECAETGSAIYTVLTTTDANGRRVDCERLLLPFGQGDRVDQIVASLQLISLEGEFKRSNVLDRFQLRAELSFSGRIISQGRKNSR